jgi:hypothetical protein
MLYPAGRSGRSPYRIHHLRTEFLKYSSFYSIYLERTDIQNYDVLTQKLYGPLHILRCNLDTKM